MDTAMRCARPAGFDRIGGDGRVKNGAVLSGLLDQDHVWPPGLAVNCERWAARPKGGADPPHHSL